MTPCWPGFGMKVFDGAAFSLPTVAIYIPLLQFDNRKDLVLGDLMLLIVSRRTMGLRPFNSCSLFGCRRGCSQGCFAAFLVHFDLALVRQLLQESLFLTAPI